MTDVIVAPGAEVAPDGLHGVRLEVVRIGPAEARALLSNNDGNRNLRPTYVAQLAGAMKRGEWRMNGDTIRLSPTGRLLDGQHRMAAVIKADVAVDFLVARGIEDSAQETMDTGARRGVGDFLKMRDEHNPTAVAAALRNVWLYDNRGTLVPNNPLPTVQQVLSVLPQQPNVREAVAPASKVRRTLKMPMSVLTTTYALFSDVDADDAAAFLRALESGAELKETDPIFALRTWVLKSLAAPHAPSSHVYAAVTIKAFNAWRDGREVSRLSWLPGGAKKEPFPLVDGRAPKFWTPKKD